MARKHLPLVVLAPLFAVAGAMAQTPLPTIDTSDVGRFYKVYDAAGGHPTAEQLQRDYLDPGSAGLHQLATMRNVSGASIAKAIAEHPLTYSRARRCMVALPRVKVRLVEALARLRQLYPEAKFPPITIAVSRTKPVGTTDPAGVRIGLEGLCATEYLNPNVQDRFVHVIAHEYGHIQQVQSLLDDEHPTVLEASLIEGVGEFTAELISGEVANASLPALARGREKAIETEFVADENKTDLSKWLYNGTNEKPGDLGYWVGYRIVKSYYQHAADKRQALREIFRMENPQAFLAKSHWYPGIPLR